MIRIIITDDDLFIRQILSAYLKSEQDLEIVATADNGKTAIELVDRLKPDIILLDLEMPEMDGISVSKIICQQYPQTKVVILSSHEREDYVTEAIEVGAVGYLFKNITPEDLTQTIRLIHKGYLQIAPGLSSQLSSSIAATNSPTNVSTIYNHYPTSVQNSLNALPTVALDEFIPPLDRFTNGSGKILFALFGVAIVLTNILKYQSTVKAPAVVRPIGDLRVVQAATSGTVRSINVRENQMVKTGAIIATLDDSQLQTQQLQLQASVRQAQQQLKQIDRQINNLNRQIAAKKRATERLAVSGEANLSLKRRGYREQKISTQAELKKANAAAKLAKEELARYRKLVNTGAISRLQISEKEAALQAALARVEQVKATLNPSSAGVTIATEKIAQEQAEGEATIAEFDRDRENLIEQKITVQKQLDGDRQELQQVTINRQKAIVRAPITGIIQQLSLRNQQQFVSAGETITQVAPSQTPLLVKTSIASGDINKIAKGQTVQLRIFSCPYTDYGTLSGTIDTIAPDISNPQNLGMVGEDKGTYEVTIQPKYLAWMGNKRECRIQSGMGAIADIITEEETVFTFLLRKARLLVDF
jgi:HlyD family secretion protein